VGLLIDRDHTESRESDSTLTRKLSNWGRQTVHDKRRNWT